MRELNELFEGVLLDHARRPRNHRRLEHATAIGEVNDPLCGDRCTVYLDVAGGFIKEMSFEGSGCAIMMATASLMTLALAGKSLEQAQAVAKQFRAMLLADAEVDDGLGDLAALAGVRELPSRIKCAMLPWRSMQAAFGNKK